MLYEVAGFSEDTLSGAPTMKKDPRTGVRESFGSPSLPRELRHDSDTYAVSESN